MDLNIQETVLQDFEEYAEEQPNTRKTIFTLKISQNIPIF